jgi:hypothetical protein
VPVSNLLKTPGFRIAVTFSATLAASILLLFFFIYWESSVVETQRVDHQLERDAEILAYEPPADVATSVMPPTGPEVSNAPLRAACSVVA